MYRNVFMCILHYSVTKKNAGGSVFLYIMYLHFTYKNIAKKHIFYIYLFLMYENFVGTAYLLPT